VSVGKLHFLLLLTFLTDDATLRDNFRKQTIGLYTFAS